MAEFYFEEFQQYLKELCIASVDVAHRDADNQAFFHFGVDDEIMALPHNAAQVCVGIGDFSGRASGEFDANQLVLIASITFLVYADNPDGDRTASIVRAQTKALQVMLDFYARMKEEVRENSCGPLRLLQAEQMTFSPIGPVLETHYGWEMSLPFKAAAPAYNPAKWND